VWDLYLANHNKAKYLPPVIPLVLYHGEGKWNLENCFSKLFNKPGPMEVFIPDFQFILLDITREPDENIKGGPILQILLKTLKYRSKPEIKEKLPEIIRLFKEIENKNTALYYLVTLVNYLVSTAGYLGNEDIEATVSKVFKEGGEIMQTIASKWKKEGKREGKREGKKETAMIMLEDGMPIEKISKYTGLTEKEIKALMS
jgi:predicted transposase/invertase (TIGR01784 family)